MKKKTILCGLALTAGLALVGCGNNDTPASTTTGGATTGGATTGDTTGGQTTGGDSTGTVNPTTTGDIDMGFIEFATLHEIPLVVLETDKTGIKSQIGIELGNMVIAIAGSLGDFVPHLDELDRSFLSLQNIVSNVCHRSCCHMMVLLIISDFYRFCLIIYDVVHY